MTASHALANRTAQAEAYEGRFAAEGAVVALGVGREAPAGRCADRSQLARYAARPGPTFVDGNGRTGRALIHFVLRRRGLAQRILPPVSLVLATWARDYIGGLTASRYRGRADSREAHQGINLWIARFAGACTRAVSDASSFERRAQEIETQWRERLGRVRAQSATDLLLRSLIGAPVITTKSAAELSAEVSPRPTRQSSDCSIQRSLRQVNVGKRNRAFEAPAIIDAFTALERQLASPQGDTRASKPVRPVPR